MPASSPVPITYNFPDASGKSVKGTEQEFVSAFARLAASNKGLDISFLENHGGKDKTSVTSLTVTVTEGKRSIKEIVDIIRAKSPYIYRLVTKKTTNSTIKNNKAPENIRDAWDDVTREILRTNADKFSTVEDVEKYLINQFKLEHNLSEDDIKLDSDLFKKIVKAVDPTIDAIDDVLERAKKQGKIIMQLRNAKNAIYDVLTAARTNARGQAVEPLLTDKQVAKVVEQAALHYISYDSDKNKAVFSAFDKKNGVPGRIGKVETKPNDKATYLAYEKISEGVYDRTKTSSGKISETKASAPAASPTTTSTGDVLVTRKAAASKYTDEERAMIARLEALKPTLKTSSMKAKLEMAKIMNL